MSVACRGYEIDCQDDEIQPAEFVDLGVENEHGGLEVSAKDHDPGPHAQFCLVLQSAIKPRNM